MSSISLGTDPLPQENVIMVSEIQKLGTQHTKQNHTSGLSEEIAKLREETNIKIEKLEKMLEEIHRQPKKCA